MLHAAVEETKKGKIFFQQSQSVKMYDAEADSEAERLEREDAVTKLLERRRLRRSMTRLVLLSFDCFQ